MSTRWHINPDTNEPGPCRARRACRFEDSSEHYDTLEEAYRASEANKESFASPRQRKTILNSRESLIKDLDRYFATIQGHPIPTRLANAHFDFNLADVKGRTLEALVSKYFAEVNIRVEREPNGPDTFPDFAVKTREDGWVPLELKEESLDSATSGRTNNRIMRIGAALDSLDRGDELFDAVFMTVGKRSDDETTTFETLEFKNFLELTGPTRATATSPGKIIGFDMNTKNLVRSSGSFSSKEEAVAAILTIYEEVKDEEWRDKAEVVSRIRERWVPPVPPGHPVLLTPGEVGVGEGRGTSMGMEEVASVK